MAANGSVAVFVVFFINKEGGAAPKGSNALLLFGTAVACVDNAGVPKGFTAAGFANVDDGADPKGSAGLCVENGSCLCCLTGGAPNGSF